MNSHPQGPKKQQSKTQWKKGKFKRINNSTYRPKKKNDSTKKSVKCPSKKTKKNISSIPIGNISDRTIKKKDQVKMNTATERGESRSSKHSRWDSVPDKDSRWDSVPDKDSRWDSVPDKDSRWDSVPDKDSRWDSVPDKDSRWDSVPDKDSRWDSGPDKDSLLDSGPQSYPDNARGSSSNGYWDKQGYGPKRAFSGYNGYIDGYDQHWSYNGFIDNGYDQHWGYSEPQNALYHLYQNHMEANKWKIVDFPTNSSQNKNGPSSSKPSASLKSKRPRQNIEEIKREAREKKEMAAQLAQEMADKQNIAAKSAKLTALLESMKNQGSLVKASFSAGHWSPSNKEQERDRPQPELDDLNLTPGELAEIGRGKNVVETVVDDEPPPVLPVYINALAAAPPSTTSGEAQERARVAYNRIVAKVGQSFRTRTMSESNKMEVLPAKRIRKASEQNTRSLEMPEMISEKDVFDVDKFKQALLKMNKRELSELVNSPTSIKSKILISALVRDHRRLISQRLNQVRFNCTSKMLVSIGANLDSTDSLLEVDMDSLPPELMVRISDIIKMEVPDVEVIAQKLTRNDGEIISCKEIKMEKSDSDEMSVEDDILEVPVPPKPAPLLVDLELPMDTKDDNVVELKENEDKGFVIKRKEDKNVGNDLKEDEDIGYEVKSKEIEDEGFVKNGGDVIKPRKAKIRVAVGEGAEDIGDVMELREAKDGYLMKVRVAKDGCDGMKTRAIGIASKNDLIPFEGLRRQPRKRGRPKKGEIRKNLGQEIVIGSIDDSSKGASYNGGADQSKNRKSGLQGNMQSPRNEIDEAVAVQSDVICHQEDAFNGEDESSSNEKNLRLVFEEESSLWREFKANRMELEKHQATEMNILQRMEFLNELKRQMFKF